jgi:hypothetical protein
MKYLYPIIEWCVEYYWIFVGIILVGAVILFVSTSYDCSSARGVLVKGALQYECIEKGLH